MPLRFPFKLEKTLSKGNDDPSNSRKSYQKETMTFQIRENSIKKKRCPFKLEKIL